MPNGKERQTIRDASSSPDVFACNWRFVRGVPSLEFLLPADVPEVAFAGRSNVGKSSLINSVLGSKSIARTSNTPGRTRELNFFEPEIKTSQKTSKKVQKIFLVDMPGYGYAKAPKSLSKRWGWLIQKYLVGRPSLRRVFVLIDSRHGPKPNDLELFGQLDRAAVSWQLVLTKADKLKGDESEKVREDMTKFVSTRSAGFPEVILTSSAKNLGIEDLRSAIRFALGLT